MSRKQNQSTDDDINKIIQLRQEIFQILEILCDIELYQPTDIRMFSSNDLIEAIQITRDVILERLNYSTFDEWKNDEKQQYWALINSIKLQIIESINITFMLSNKKTLSFVNSYNMLIVDRISSLIHLIGPSGGYSLISPLIDEMINVVNNVTDKSYTEKDRQKNYNKAVISLDTFRNSANAIPRLTKQAREHMIRNICEKVQLISE